MSRKIELVKIKHLRESKKKELVRLLQARQVQSKIIPPTPYKNLIELNTDTLIIKVEELPPLSKKGDTENGC